MEGPGFQVDAPPPGIVAFRVSEGPEVDAETGEKVRVGLKASVEVWPKGAIELQFDRYLDPRTVTRGAFCLSSDTSKPKTREECLAPEGVAPAYDPVTRTVVLYLEEALELDTQYQLTIFTPTDGDEETEPQPGLRAFDGVPYARTLTFFFDTAATDDDAELEGPQPFDEDCNQSLRLALGGCSGCHTTSSPSPGGVALDPETAHLNVGVVAHGTQKGGDATTPQSTPITFGVNMPVIDAQAPGNSYLLYKAMAAVQVSDGTLASGEADRLRAFITGLPMPAAEPEIAPFDEETHLENMKYVSRWIAAGAPACEAPPIE